ncbi:RBBP9/YdeN family alpha/beta hydrolase [Kineococcus sp. SYSU DK018]|uniref:RBBP9/YdeN family alpha/beta hydrolase n=1 Tax=Kineococcus sp. SYSU DK018 TaxID=3383139 RepID=UPI003D7E18DB
MSGSHPHLVPADPTPQTTTAGAVCGAPAGAPTRAAPRRSAGDGVGPAARRAAPRVRRVVVVHGYAATPTDHWFTWLADQLTAAGVEVAVPALPDPQEPDAAAWLATTAAAVEAAGGVDEHTHLVAHSLGCVTVLRHLATLLPAPGDSAASGSWRLGGLTLVAGFTGPLPALPQLDGYLAEPATGGVPTLDEGVLQRIADRTRRLNVLRSERDVYVPTTATDDLAARLGTRAQVVDGAGHFTADDGITVLPPVLNTVTS